MTTPPRGPAAATALLTLMLWASAASAAAEAAGVSPGAAKHAVDVPSACPTFSWASVPGAEGYELAVFEAHLGPLEGAAAPVLRLRIASAASSWTPSRARCLQPGRDYAWVVRALGAAGGEWSEPLRFRVPATPSAEELRSALAVLQRWQATAGGAAAGAVDAGTAGTGASARGTAPPAPEVDPGTSVAAIRADMPNASGAAYGLLAVSHSPQGAGVVARNEASGGADLVLDGTADGEGDTLLSQAGIDRPAAGAQTFNVHNSGGGAMTLQVEGVAVDVATTPIGWTRLTGMPAGFADGVDDDTTYAAGNQLQLAATTFDVVEGPGSGLDADTLDGAELAGLQARVTGTCPLGLTLQGINADGTVACYAAAGPPRLTIVDAAPTSTGTILSLASGSDGLPVLSYHDDALDTLKVVKCNDPACRGGDESIATVDDPANQVGEASSLAIGPDGFPVISYYDQTATALKVAKCNDAACAGGNETITTVDNAGNVGFRSSIAIGADGFPVISYLDQQSPGRLKVVKCNDPACAGGGELISTVDAGGAGASSIAIGAGGMPIIAYTNPTSTALAVARCNDPACTGGDELLVVVDNSAAVGTHPAIAIGTDGLPVISYRDDSATALKVARCNSALCAGGVAVLTTVDDSGNVGLGTAIAIGNDGLPVISYVSFSGGGIKAAKCNDVACTGGDETITTVDAPAVSLQLSTGIAIGADGFPVIGYLGLGTVRDLRVAKCANTSCAF